MRRAATLGIGLLVGIAIFATLSTNIGDGGTGPVPDINAAAPPVLDEEGQKDALRMLGGELCEQGADKDERNDLRTELLVSLDADDLEFFWRRAASGKTRDELDRAFFGCKSLTTWMRKRAKAEGVDVAAIIAVEAADESADDLDSSREGEPEGSA